MADLEAELARFEQEMQSTIQNAENQNGHSEHAGPSGDGERLPLPPSVHTSSGSHWSPAGSAPLSAPAQPAQMQPGPAPIPPPHFPHPGGFPPPPNPGMAMRPPMGAFPPPPPFAQQPMAYPPGVPQAYPPPHQQYAAPQGYDAYYAEQYTAPAGVPGQTTYAAAPQTYPPPDTAAGTSYAAAGYPAAAPSQETLANIKAALTSQEKPGGGGGANKRKAIPRQAAGKKWYDATLVEWPENDYRIFVGDLGNEVNDDTLTKAFAKYDSMAKAKIVRDKRSNKSKGFGFVSFTDLAEGAKALREMNGKYIGNRPCKLRKSSWEERNQASTYAGKRKGGHTEQPKAKKTNVLHK